MAQPTSNLFPPELEAEFEPVRILGAGAIGTVFLARDRALDRLCAVKILQMSVDADMRARFKKASLSMARLKHPHVIQIFAQGFLPIGPYVVMEYLQGDPLDARRPPADPLGVLLQVAEGLEEIHRVGLVYRDVKPSNIILTSDGRAVLLDFDLVYDPSRTQTCEGMLIGTLNYLSPELLAGTERPAPPADWYSWGATLYALVEGDVPFRDEAIRAAISGTPLPPVEFRKVPRDSPMARLLTTCLSPDPSARPRSVREILALTEGRVSKAMDPSPPPLEPAGPSDFSKLATRPPPPPPAPRLLPALALVCLGLGMGLVLRSGQGPSSLDPVFVDAPVGPGRSDPPFGAAFAQSVRAELEEAVGSFRDLDGRKFKPAAGTATVGLSPVLDPDPLKIARVVSDLPSIALFHRWIAQGNQPERLPDGLREAMRELDRSLVERDQPALFEPYCSVGPVLEAVVPPADLAPFFTGKPTPRITGWGGAALSWYQDARRLYSGVDDDLRRARSQALPDRFPETLARHIRFIPATGLEDVVVAVQVSPDYRAQMAGWLGPGTVMTQRMLYCAARSIRDEAESRESIALAIRRGLFQLPGFCYASFVRLEPEVVLGGRPTSPAGWWLLSGLLEMASRAEMAALGRSVPLFERELEALQEASSLAGDDPLAQQRQALALVALVERSCAWSEQGRGAPVWRSNRERLAALPDRWTYLAWIRIGEALVKPGDRVKLEAHEVEEIVEWLADHRAGVLAGTGPWVDDLLVKLRSLLPG